MTEQVMVALYRTALDEDLRALSGLLWHCRIAHRIAEEGGEQVVRLQDEARLEEARQLLERWQKGAVQVTVVPSEARASSGVQLMVDQLLAAPVTFALIALSVVGFLVASYGSPELVSLFSYRPFEIRGASIIFLPEERDLWRPISPVFLHFGLTHIVFNSLWCWDLGHRIEGRLGSLHLSGLFVVTGVVSNVVQDQVSGPVLFGGLSGVVYALLGFAWVSGRLNPQWRSLAPATPVMLFMVGWLVVCVLGVVDVLGFSVANGAHVAGLLCGAAIGLVFALVYRPTPS